MLTMLIFHEVTSTRDRLSGSSVGRASVVFSGFPDCVRYDGIVSHGICEGSLARLQGDHLDHRDGQAVLIFQARGTGAAVGTPT